MTVKKKRELHPSVQEFKEFVKRHPKIIQEVRNGEKTWQQLYQGWYLLGEDDEMWDQYKTGKEFEEKEESREDKKPNSKMLGKVMSLVRNMDPEQMQGQMNNLQNIASNIQELMNIFRGASPSPNTEASNPQQQNPFTFQKD